MRSRKRRIPDGINCAKIVIRPATIPRSLYLILINSNLHLIPLFTNGIKIIALFYLRRLLSWNIPNIIKPFEEIIPRERTKPGRAKFMLSRQPRIKSVMPDIAVANMLRLLEPFTCEIEMRAMTTNRISHIFCNVLRSIKSAGYGVPDPAKRAETERLLIALPVVVTAFNELIRDFHIFRERIDLFRTKTGDEAVNMPAALFMGLRHKHIFIFTSILFPEITNKLRETTDEIIDVETI